MRNQSWMNLRSLENIYLKTNELIFPCLLIYRTKLWKRKKNRDIMAGRKITCGLLPTLQVLATRGCSSQSSVCFLPVEGQTDSASHLQITLLEAYCRENGIEVIRVSKDTLKSMMCPSATDLSCVLVTSDEPYFLESPEWFLSTSYSGKEIEEIQHCESSWMMRGGRASRGGKKRKKEKKKIVENPLNKDWVEKCYFNLSKDLGSFIKFLIIWHCAKRIYELSRFTGKGK